MKIGVLYSLVVLLVLLTSCMGVSTDKQNFGGQLGVAQLDPEKGIVLENGTLIYSPSLDTMSLKAGDCSLLNYALDWSTKEAGNGYNKYQAEIFSYLPVEVHQLSEVLTDTTRILDLERFISFSLARSNYFKGRFFLFTEHSKYVNGQVNLFELSYNPKEKAVTDRYNNRFYNLYFRTALQQAVNDSLGSKFVMPVALDIQKFVDEKSAIEKSAGMDSLKFKLNYPHNYNKDTTACVWTASDLYKIPIR